MKRNKLILPVLFVIIFFGCSASTWRVPDNFNSFVLGEGTIGDGVISYKLKIESPKSLRHSGIISLPVKKSANVFFKLDVKFNKSISVFKKGKELTFLRPGIVIKSKGKSYKYRLYPYMTKDGFFYGTQVIFPVHEDKYYVELIINENPDIVIDSNLKPLLHNIPFFSGESYNKTFLLYLSMFYL